MRAIYQNPHCEPSNLTGQPTKAVIKVIPTLFRCIAHYLHLGHHCSWSKFSINNHCTMEMSAGITITLKDKEIIRWARVFPGVTAEMLFSRFLRGLIIHTCNNSLQCLTDQKLHITRMAHSYIHWLWKSNSPTTKITALSTVKCISHFMSCASSWSGCNNCSGE